MAHSITVFVLTYTHKHGTDISLYNSEQHAQDAAADLARLYWDGRSDRTAPDAADGLSGDALIAAYFDEDGAGNGETFAIIPTDFTPEPTIADLAEELRGRHTTEVPDHPRSYWRFAVGNEDTILGYWDWIAAALAPSGNDHPQTPQS